MPKTHSVNNKLKLGFAGVLGVNSSGPGVLGHSGSGNAVRGEIPSTSDDNTIAIYGVNSST